MSDECTIDLTRTPHLREMLGLVIDDAKREYCGPYLIALPLPEWWVSYVPTVPPYRIVVTRIFDGNETAQRATYLDQRNAISALCDFNVADDHFAEVVDSLGDWIARKGPRHSR